MVRDGAASLGSGAPCEISPRGSGRTLAVKIPPRFEPGLRVKFCGEDQTGRLRRRGVARFGSDALGEI